MERPRALRPAALPAAALAALALLGLLQAAPLPAGLAAALSPGHAALERQAAALERRLRRRRRLTLAASSTRSGGPRLGGGGGGLPRRARWPASAAGAGAGWRGAVLAGGPLPGLLRRPRLVRPRAHAVGGGAAPPPSRLRGTFVNPNHLAAYLEMALPVAFAWSWWALRRARDEPRVERRIAPRGPAGDALADPVRRALLHRLARRPAGGGGGRLGPGGAGGGGAPALVARPAGGGGGARRRRPWWRRSAAQEGLGRLLSTTRHGRELGRPAARVRRGARLWRRFPATGAGLGTFRDAFPLVAAGGPPGHLVAPAQRPPGGAGDGGARRGGACWRPGSAGSLRAAAGGAARRRPVRGPRRGAGGARRPGLARRARGARLRPHHAGQRRDPGGPPRRGGHGAGARGRSAQLDHARQDPAPVEALELQHVEPAPERRRHPKRRRRGARGRLDREMPHGRAVEP